MLRTPLCEDRNPRRNRATHECPRCNIQSKTPQSASERLSAWRSSDTTVVARYELVGAILVIVDDHAVDGVRYNALLRRDGRVVECARLEIWYTFTRI